MECKEKVVEVGSSDLRQPTTAIKECMASFSLVSQLKNPSLPLRPIEQPPTRQGPPLIAGRARRLLLIRLFQQATTAGVCREARECKIEIRAAENIGTFLGGQAAASHSPPTTRPLPGATDRDRSSRHMGRGRPAV
jgi:hypothetical protein